MSDHACKKSRQLAELATIESSRTTPIPARNAYRAILRRDYPEPLIALLVFILGVWLWDHYFGKPAGYPPGTEQIALVKIDRDLRVAEMMADDPAWLRWLAGAGTVGSTREEALIALGKLSAEQAMGGEGLEAYAIILAVHEGLPARQILNEILQGRAGPDFVEKSTELAAHRGTWWHARWVGEFEQDLSPVDGWRDAYDAGGRQLRVRVIAVRSGVWLLGLAGLIFVPQTLIRLTHGLRAKPSGYGGAWSAPLGLVVFLVAVLASVGFTMTLDLGIGALPGLHPLAGILLDSAARLLPALIALGLLFRRPSHAARVLGLNQPPNARLILGLFSILMMIDLLLRALMPGTGPEPGEGLGVGEAGLWGLAFAVVSACLLAPVAEEILYRGILFRSLWNRLGVLPAAVFSSAVFAVLHFYGGYGLISVGVFGISCALLYAATGSLTACIGLHVLYNSAIKLPEWLIYHAPLG